MTQDEFKKLQLTVVNMLSGEDLVDKTPRTLMYGIGDYWNSVHTYFDGEDILMCGWDEGDKHAYEMSPHDNRGYIPECFVRPAYCDFEFCQLLLKAGESIPFSDWNGARTKELRRL